MEKSEHCSAPCTVNKELASHKQTAMRIQKLIKLVRNVKRVHLTTVKRVPALF